MRCPYCQHPVSLPRRLFGSYLWATWDCPRCGSRLAHDKLRRIVIGLNAGLVLGVAWVFLGRSLPLWLAVVVFAMLFVLMFLAYPQFARLVVLKRKGHYCASCGYDLTCNETGQCPECGMFYSVGKR